MSMKDFCFPIQKLARFFPILAKNVHGTTSIRVDVVKEEHEDEAPGIIGGGEFEIFFFLLVYLKTRI